MSKHMNQLQYISTNRQVIPGLKVAYGSAASYFGPAIPDEDTNRKKGFFARLRETVVNLVTEEAETDRPIGISQLSRNTFKASEAVAGQTIVSSQRTTQDYRFNQLIEQG